MESEQKGTVIARTRTELRTGIVVNVKRLKRVRGSNGSSAQTAC
jgi:hypothetical protein